MTKQELMENYTAEQIADKVIELETIIDDKLGGWSKHGILYNDFFSMQDENAKLQSKVEKYRKAFEDAKKEHDCKIAEYQNRVDKDKTELERARNTINQIDYILEKLFGVRHDTVDTPDEFEKILMDMVKGNATDLLPTEPIKVADMLINATYTREKGDIEKTFYKAFGDNSDMVEENVFDISELRQIAEHLLVYCNHNGEVEE